MRDIRARRIAGFGLTSPDAARLAGFYVTAFGARFVASEHLTGEPLVRRSGVRGGALCHHLALGRETIEILQFDTPGQPYPHPISPDETVFQHFAIVVTEMELAVSRLRRIPGWTPISIGGPQRLPGRSGGVTAFKFQDPDGHPLELLAFPERGMPRHWRAHSREEIFLGIDHSAISVRDTAISTDFYRTLGFGVTTQTLNHGEAQANLDGVPGPQVEVTALSLDAPTPHLELLCYRSGVQLPRTVWAGNDVAATRIALAADRPQRDLEATQRLVVDPDGHHLLLMCESTAPHPRSRGELR
jgi:catechol 2,3-dioxygenase-like lactoylglutathione lyase family enzyme